MRTRCDISGPPVAVGIDLGTRNTRVAAWQDGDVVVIPNERGRLATPAVVAFTESGVLVGEAAEEQAEGNLENTIYAPTRLLGCKFESTWVQWSMSMRPYSIVRGEGGRPHFRVQERGKERLVRPEELVTLLVENLRRSAERFLGSRVAEAVITVPAQFGPQQCAALAEACGAARLKVLELVKAPTAAGIAFCQMNPTPSRQSLLVCDIGGSYFDFSLLSVEEGTVSERAVGTDYVDLDSALLRFAVRDLRERYCVIVDRQHVPLHRLRAGCEAARRKLAQYHQAWIEVKEIVAGVDYSAGVSRAHFEDCCLSDMEHILDPVDWCLEDCGLSKAEVEVVLVGGNARVPQVRRLVRSFFYGRAPHEVLRPDHAAVLGAAVYVALLTGHPATAAAAAPAADAAAGDPESTAPPPPHPKPMRLRQVAPGCSEEAGAAGGCEEESGEESGEEPGNLPARQSDDLEPAPCNEVTGFPMPLAGRAPRPASALRLPPSPVPRVPPLPFVPRAPSPQRTPAWLSQKFSQKASSVCGAGPGSWL